MSVNNYPADNDTATRILYFSLSLFVLIVVMRGLSLMTIGDDVYFSNALNDKSLLDFLYSRYNSWSGRTLLEAITVISIRTPIIWKIAIPSCLLMMCLNIWKLTLSKSIKSCFGSIVVIFFVLLVSKSVARDGGWWVTGFYNYLLPTSLGIFAFRVVIYKAESAIFTRYLSIIAAVICCQQEQAAIALISSLIAVIIFRKNKGLTISFDSVVFLFGVISAGFLFLAPGNYNRLQIETRWLPEFSQMGLIEKLMLGLDRVSEHVNDIAGRVILLASLMTFLVAFIHRRKWNLKPVALIIIGVFILNVLLKQIGLEDYSDKLNFLGFIGPDSWYRYEVFYSYTLTILLYGMLISCSLYVSDSIEELVSLVGSLCLSVALVMAVSFSPTVYASGSRILYISDILLVIYSCLLLGKLLGSGQSGKVAIARSVCR